MASNAGESRPDASLDGGGSGSLPVVTGPITGGSTGKPFTASPLDLASYGYVEEEYFFAGTATAYDWVTPPGEDGVWSVKTTTTASYKTRMLVRRPTDPTKFNGTVIVEWFNDTGGIDADPEFGFAHAELLRSGFGYVGVSAQAQGVVGGGFSLSALTGITVKPLVQEDPERYGSLHHPGDDYAYDIYTQAARALRHPAAVDPLGGLTPARFIGDGESQSAIRMVTYVNAIHPIENVFDGFFIHSRFSGGALISGFADAGVNAILAGPSPAHIRGDLTVPVFQFETETDVPGLTSGLLGQGFAVSRQPDTARLRTWEVAGTAHADQYLIDYEEGPDGGDAGDSVASVVGSCGDINAGPQHWVEDTAMNAVQAWTANGQLPPTGEPFTLTDAGTAIAQDSYGNALGGVRTAAVDVPIATYSGQPSSSVGGGLTCSFFGQTTPFASAQLAMLYSSHDDYVSKVTTATVAAQQAGFILAADAPLIEQEAQSAPVPQ
ncbi:MAG: alpha/beta hydrolase domain-containing protein [Polyangiaceae bacterium]